MAAVNPAVFAPAGTVSVVGKATAALLLAKLTTKPPLEAALLSVTVHPSDPDPVIEPMMHERLAIDGVGVEVDMPEPLSCTTVVGRSAALLVMVTCPDAVPPAEGLKRTSRL
jgi:hypothetical protein